MRLNYLNLAFLCVRLFHFPSKLDPPLSFLREVEWPSSDLLGHLMNSRKGNTNTQNGNLSKGAKECHVRHSVQWQWKIPVMKGVNNRAICVLVFLACMQEAHNLNFHSNINIMPIINHEYLMKFESIIYTCLISQNVILNSECLLSMERLGVCCQILKQMPGGKLHLSENNHQVNR